MNRSRKFLAIVLVLVMVFAFVPSAFAANTPQASAADKLHALGMLAGTGTNPDGSINFELGASINRAQAVTLIVNLLGKYDEATSQTWETPFTDVPGWAAPFVGYAYANKITSGTSETTFGSTSPVLAKQYLTFVLNALGYEPGIDFTYDRAWEKSDALKFTNGRYNAQTTQFLRGDAISVTFDSLSAVDKSTGKPLYEKLIATGIFTKDLADKVGLGIASPPVTESKVVQDIKAGKKLVEFGDYTWRVLSVEGDKALIITEDIIDIRAYNDEYVDITWENCTLRKYLNNEFYNTFSASEQSQILTTRVINADNSEYGTPGENDTDDKIFLLSVDEANRYFSSDEDRVARPNTQALSKLHTFYQSLDVDAWYTDFVNEYDNSWLWWLRSPGNVLRAALVYGVGSVYAGGYYVANPDVGVRPALYINLGIGSPPVTGSKVVADIKAGKRLVEFGDYTWRVLSVEGDKALIITEDIIDIRAYSDEWVDITWENCTLRKYLNNEFYNTFTASEKSQILTTWVINADNPDYGTPGGNNADDKIFLLSIDEANRYFSSDEDRVARLNTQALSKLHTLYQPQNDDDEWWWWLRSPGYGSYFAASVYYDGGVEAGGDLIDASSGGVRPAFYINLKS